MFTSLISRLTKMYERSFFSNNLIKRRRIMRILMINKFLYPNGGSETYMFKLGKFLKSKGHEVQFFGMEHENRCVGNNVDAYTSNIDFHDKFTILKLLYPLKTIYSRESRVKIRKVLDDFKPDVCHLNNFNYQLTPSIILEIKKWNKNCKIVYTAHDGQLVCPNHLMRNPITHKNCEKCLNGNFFNCVKNKCIHCSRGKSLIGTIEALFWNLKGTYKYIDRIICCSDFIKTKLDSNPVFREKTIVLHNFIDSVPWEMTPKKDYILYFGRFSEEKGVDLLLDVCSELPELKFKFAGDGPLEGKVNSVKNVENLGFLSGKDLERVIREAKFSICPSSCMENCPFSVMESQMYGTPVLGANISGIPELIQIGSTGELFESENKQDLKRKIIYMNESKIENYVNNCKNIRFDTIQIYYERLRKIYE